MTEKERTEVDTDEEGGPPTSEDKCLLCYRIE
jgi:hypothetical protein